MTTRIVATAALIALASGPALADEDCDVPMARWQPREAVRTMIEERGWRLLRIKIHDGCYEAYVTDENGRRFEAVVDPATLAIIDIEAAHRHR